MKQYKELLEKIITQGTKKSNRTGIDTYSITGAMFSHDLREGFPLLTTKIVSAKNVFVELEGFIKGINSKQWYKDRKCFIWNDWCNPEKVPYGNDDETKAKMAEEDDLGRIYGVYWRRWKGYEEVGPGQVEPYEIDQLKNVIDTLKTDPTNRRMIVTAWSPSELQFAALPACHTGFQILSDGKYVDLCWNQRSNDVPLGTPYNIASYAMLLKLIAKEVDMIPRKLIGFLADCHIYENQLDGVREQLKREERPLPQLEITNWDGIFNWTYEDFELTDYNPHPRIKFPLAV